MFQVKAISETLLPSSKDNLKLHISRANYVANMYVNAIKLHMSWWSNISRMETRWHCSMERWLLPCPENITTVSETFDGWYCWRIQIYWWRNQRYQWLWKIGGTMIMKMRQLTLTFVLSISKKCYCPFSLYLEPKTCHKYPLISVCAEYLQLTCDQVL